MILLSIFFILLPSLLKLSFSLLKMSNKTDFNYYDNKICNGVESCRNNVENNTNTKIVDEGNILRTSSKMPSFLQNLLLIKSNLPSLSEEGIDETPTTTPPKFPKKEKQEEFIHYYMDWIDFILEEIKNEKISKFPNATFEQCSDNAELRDLVRTTKFYFLLKNMGVVFIQGCLILIPTCYNFTVIGYPQYWSCNMLLWEACRCKKCRFIEH